MKINGKKITLRRIKLAWKYRRYRKLWSHRYEIGAILAAVGVAAGILFRPTRIVTTGGTAQ